MEKPLNNFIVSFYENKYSKTPVEISLYEIMRDIKKGKYAEAITTIRRYFNEGDHEAAQYQKGRLPCFTASGTFNGAHAISNLKEHSGVIMLDYDKVKNRAALHEACINDPHTMFTFDSPINGCKVGVYVEGAAFNHRAAYELVSNYYQQLTGLISDTACKDPSRLCYMSYDEEAYVAPFYKAFVLPEEARNTCPQIAENCETVPEQPAKEELPEAPEKEVQEFVMSWIFLYPMREGQRNVSLFKLSCEACKRGYLQKAVIRAAIPHFRDETFSKQEVVNTVASGYKKVRSDMGQKTGNSSEQGKVSKVSKVSFSFSEDEEEKEEAYWEGEDLRRNTPCFPEEMYENIPEMLRMCIPDGLNVREKDLLLLSLLTAYSAIMPGTWGNYNHKRYSPNLYILGIAPAGSGKSVAQWAELLLEDVQREILAESNRQQELYHIQKMEWQAACTEKMRKKEKIDYKQQPREPLYRSLIMSGSTSQTRMQIQMHDNGDMGGIIIDTEAQSLANANRQDYGHFDDMLCKAYEHETISSSYKINGMKPVVVARPKLSMLLTGTSGQVYLLIENAENGLLSRMLIYTFRQDPVWKEIEGGERNREDLFSSLAPRAALLYHFCRQHVCIFRFSATQWNKLNSTFRKRLSEVVMEGNDNLQAVVKRYGAMVMRIAMVLTRLRQYEDQLPGQEFTCEDIDFKTAMDIVTCCYEHTRLIISSMPAGRRQILKNPDNKRNFFDSLPAKFTTNEAIEQGAVWGIATSTVKRLLFRWKEVKIRKVSHGVYEKIEGEKLKETFETLRL